MSADQGVGTCTCNGTGRWCAVHDAGKRRPSIVDLGMPPTDEEERIARAVLGHIRIHRGWYGGKMIEPYETMAVAKLALAIRAALDEERAR